MLIGISLIIMTFIVAYFTLPIIMMWFVGIPLAVIIGIALDVSAILLRDENTKKDCKKLVITT